MLFYQEEVLKLMNEEKVNIELTLGNQYITEGRDNIYISKKKGTHKIQLYLRSEKDMGRSGAESSPHGPSVKFVDDNGNRIPIELHKNSKSATPAADVKIENEKDYKEAIKFVNANYDCLMKLETAETDEEFNKYLNKILKNKKYNVSLRKDKNEKTITKKENKE